MAQESKNENRKQRIREAFHDGKQVERMPAREDMAPQHSDDVIYRVAPYCRVSTMSEMQAESFEIQQQYYNEYIAKHPNWTLVRIYADEGISATSVKNRKDFNNMIEDCKAGKIDLIVTKSVSRFARTDTLIQLCTQHCLPFEYDMRYFTLQTIAGKWRIDMSLRPVRLEHINLVTERGSTKKFHTQPRLFLSLKDTFDYIMRHDSKLIEEIVAKDNQSQELAMG